MTERDLRQLLAQAQQMPEGDARIALLEDLVRHADASGDARLAFDVRMELTGAYQHGGETGKGFVTFSWCLAAFDRDPGGFTEHDDALLRWQYKWTVSALQRFPEVPLDRSYRALDDLERRYRTGGHSLHVVHTLRCGIADHIGDLSAGDEWYRKWCAAPRDENSDCVACDPTNKVLHLSLRGRDEEAVAVAEPVLRGRITCTVQPQSIQSVLLLPYLRTGRLDEAREAHRRAYRAIRGNRDYLEDLGRHLQFCAVTGNEARGLEILERHLGWLDRPADPMALLEVTGSAALLLRRLRESGQGGQRVRRPGFRDRPTTELEVAELEAELRATALGLAARFDARNRTDFQGRTLEAKLAAEPVVDRLPLSRARSRPAVAPAVVSVPVESTSDTGRVDPEGLLKTAEDWYAQRRSDRGEPLLRRFDEVTRGSDLDPLLAARRADLRGAEQAEANDLPGAERTWREVAERYADLGEETRRQVALARLGMIWLRMGRVAEGMALVEASADHLREHGTPLQQAASLERQAVAWAGTGDPERALGLLDELCGDPVLRDQIPEADVALVRGMACLALDREAEALTCVSRARDGFRADGNFRQYAWACLQHGRMLADRSEVDEAAEAFAEAAAHGGHDLTLRADALAMRGVILARSGGERAEEAADDLVEAVAIYTELGLSQAFHARFDLAVAFANAGRLLDAAEAAEEGLSGLEQVADPQAAPAVAGFRELLVRLYRGLGEKDDALQQVDELIRYLVDGPAEPLARAYETAGEILDELDRDGLAAERFAAAARTYQRAGDLPGQIRANRRRALSLHWSGDSGAGLALVAETERLIDGLPGDEPEYLAWERAVLAFDEARILARLGRVQEAVPRALAAAQGFRDAGAPDEAGYADDLVRQLTAQDPG